MGSSLGRYDRDVITVRGEEYGTAAELARRLGGDVTVAMVRRWRERDGLDAIQVGRTVYSPLRQAARIEAAKRRGGRGRPRRVDDRPMIAA